MRPSLAAPFALIALLIVGQAAKAEVIINSADWSILVNVYGKYPNQSEPISDSKQSFGTRTSSSSYDSQSVSSGGPIASANATASSYGNNFYANGSATGGDPYGSGFSTVSWTIKFTVIGKEDISFLSTGYPGLLTYSLKMISPVAMNFDVDDISDQFRLLDGIYQANLSLDSAGYLNNSYPVSGQISFSAVPEVGTLLSCSAGLLVLFGFHPSCRSLVRRRLLPSTIR